VKKVVQSIPELLSLAASATPERVALAVNGVGTMTFKQWKDRAHSLGHALAGFGISFNDRIILNFEKRQWMDSAIAYIGVQLAGAIPVLCSGTTASSEIARISNETGAVALLSSKELFVYEEGIGKEIKVLSLTRAIEEIPTSLSHPPLSNVADVIYTSGTTGLSLGVTSTHSNLLKGTGGPPPLWNGKSLIHSFPPCSAAGTQGVMLMQLKGGMTSFALPVFDPELFCRTVAEHNIEIAYLVPSMVRLLLDYEPLEEFDLSSLEFILVTGSMFLPQVFAGLAARLSHVHILNVYGATEAGAAQVFTTFDQSRPGSVGRPSGLTQVRILSSEGIPLPNDQIGEIALKRRNVQPREYYNRPVETSQVFVDGWTKTGDLGYLDCDGYLYLIGRKKDVIIVGGENVSALELEYVLERHHAIREAAVVAIPDALLGERPLAFLVGDVEDACELAADYLRDLLPAWKTPIRYIRLNSLPKNAMEKVDKRALRILAQEFVPVAPTSTAPRL
jgi:acyl-CoA synthetase (AMP-forming)/AMP-acid ligase II